MAKDNFDDCIKVSLGYEGGYSSIRSDPGNWTGGKVGKGQLKGTKYGIAASSHPTLDIKNLTVAQAKMLYRSEYWNKVRGDDLPYGVDLSANDYGINSGPSRSVKALQSIVGVKQDGQVGPQTLKALIMADTKAAIQKHCGKRTSFLKGLSTWKTFGKGWSSRVANVEAKAVAMFLASGGPLTADHSAELNEEAEKANDKAASQNKSASGAAGSGAIVGGGDAITSSEPNWLLISIVGVSVALIVVGLIIRSRHNKERAAAYKAAAESG